MTSEASPFRKGASIAWGHTNFLNLSDMNKRKTLIVCLAIWALQASSLWALDSFVETFNGTGPFESASGGISGLDNPGWDFFGDGEIKNGGYAYFNAPPPGVEQRHGDLVTRYLFTNCSYTERVELSDVKMIGASAVRFDHAVTGISSLTTLFARLGFRLDINNSQVVLVQDTPVSTHVAMEFRYDEELSEATFGFDLDYRDEVPILRYGPFPYKAENSDQIIRFSAYADLGGEMSGVLDNWSLSYDCEASLGDFNNSGALDVEDIDLLSSAVRVGTNEPTYDLNADQLVDDLDRTVWVETLRKTYFGDSNLDGEFNTADLVQVFQAGLYEDAIDGNAGWASGDWNGDADFNSRDLVLAFQSGGYEAGPRPAAVPEPSASLLLLIGIAMAARRRV
jgi:hypothetical protein